MTQFNTLNVKLSNSQLNKLISAIKKWNRSNFKSLNIVDDSNDKNNFPNKLLLINTQVSKLRKAFSSGLSANRKLVGLLGSLLTTGFSLIQNVLKPLANRILI